MSSRVKKTILVAFFVSISSLINFDLLTEGFIVALSIMVMAIFIYCYEDLSAAYIACLSGVFAPLFRGMTLYVANPDIEEVIRYAMPDMAYYFAYAAVYTLIYRFIIREPKNMRNFPYAIFFSDMLSNVAEMLTRGIMTGEYLLEPSTVAYIAFIALIRTILVMAVIVAIEAYSTFILSKERDGEYKRLLIQASTVAAEMRLIDKNVKEVEAVTKSAYEHYNEIRQMDLPPDVVNQALTIAKNSHEIKGDYQNVQGVLQEIYMEGLDNTALGMSEIVSLEKTNINAFAKRNGHNNIDIITKVRSDFPVKDPFKMMSVLRNLLTNATEAIGKKPGRIVLTVTEVPKEDGGGHKITIRDNGPGIREADIEDLFLEGYSTKFDQKTGAIQRGLGLCLVKDYVENDFGGTLSIDSKVGEFTEFSILLPEVK